MIGLLLLKKKLSRRRPVGVLALEIFRNFIARACTRLADGRLNGRKRYADDDDLEGIGEDFIISGITEESIICIRVCYTRVKNLLKISYVCVCLYAYVTSACTGCLVRL